MAIQWSLVIFTALTGAAGWMLACIAYNELRGNTRSSHFTAALVAIVVLAVGGCASVTHLSHPENIMGALGHPTSGIFIEICLVAATGIFCLAYLLLKKREAGAGALKATAALAALFGVVLSFMAGESYVMASQPAWNTQLMPLGYCLTAMPLGVGLYLLVCVNAKEDVSQETTLLLVAGALAAVGALLFAIGSGRIADALPLVVGGAAVVGGAVPAVCAALARGKKEQLLVLIAAAVVCALIGAVCYRCGMWVIGSGVNDFFLLSIG
ncbi:MAG: DmsC/YnfH family molybdoenzyme membrane anchor subunit [Coriobacteriales bacterium]